VQRTSVAVNLGFERAKKSNFNLLVFPALAQK
jgi:hypothetical protein